MKKIAFFLALLIMVLASKSLIYALDREPAGKNLINPEHFYTDSTNMYTTSPLAVEPNTTYTFAISTMIGATALEDSVKILQGDSVLVDANISHDNDTCSPKHVSGDEKLICTFETNHKTHLDIEVIGDMDPRGGLQDLEGVQLELGDTYTGYEPFIAASEPEFQGEGLLVLDYDDTLYLDEIIGTYITAYDEIDGDLTDDIEVVSDTYTGHEDTVGEYSVAMEVFDSSGNGAAFDLTIKIQDTNPPEIIGSNVIEVSVDDQKSLADLIDGHFEFYDGHDGEIETYSILKDDYSDHKDELGDKEVRIMIEDSSENQTELLFRVRIKDETPPTIEGPSAYDVYLSESLHEDDLYALFEVSDNHTEASEIDFSITSETHPSALDEIGQYTLIFKAIDESGNEASHELNIEIIDDVKPTLEGPNHIEISYQQSLDFETLKSDLVVEDNHCDLSQADITILTHDYEAEVPGTYEIDYKVSDSSGNKAYHTTVIHVIDDVPPTFILDEQIVVSSNTVIDETMILDYVKSNLDEDKLDLDSLTISDNPYEGNETKAGFYEVAIDMKDTHGNQHQETVLIEVKEIEEDASNRWLFIPITLLSLISGVVIFKRFK